MHKTWAEYDRKPQNWDDLRFKPGKCPKGLNCCVSFYTGKDTSRVRGEETYRCKFLVKEDEGLDDIVITCNAVKKVG